MDAGDEGMRSRECCCGREEKATVTRRIQLVIPGLRTLGETDFSVTVS